MTIDVDVLCAGLACYDLVFSVERQPDPDEKVFADQFFDCGGGPAANAAVAAARLGARSAFAGYLGNDLFGQRHLAELKQAGVYTDLVVVGEAATPLSAVVVKPDGRRMVINYKDAAEPLTADCVDLDRCRPRVILLDGHQPEISQRLVNHARRRSIPTVLDAGSLHAGTRLLVEWVDFVVASEKFARQYSGHDDARSAAEKLYRAGVSAVVTQGPAGLIWRTDAGSGRMSAFDVNAVDTTGAGDAFHGAFAAGLAAGMPWLELLRYASAVGALCCLQFGARLGLPDAGAVDEFMQRDPEN